MTIPIVFLASKKVTEYFKPSRITSSCKDDNVDTNKEISAQDSFPYRLATDEQMTINEYHKLA